MHILVFPGWYPSRLDELSGDFVQRHMQAIALKGKVTVIIPVKDGTINKAERVEAVNGNLTEIYVYYPSLTSIQSIDSFFSFVRYSYVALKTATTINRKHKADMVQLYVLQKNLLLGFLLQWIIKVPFVVSEQSTFYVDGRLEKAGWFQKKAYAYILSKASSIHAVSNYLLANIRKKLTVKTYGVVIPNVVDTNLFVYKARPVNNPVTFVHVSNMVPQKNVEGMLQAFAEVKKKGLSFKLNLVGPVPSHIPHLIADLALENEVLIWGARKYKEVANIMDQSDFFVFFTRYETFGCVIIEANASGLPVIATDLDVTRELITDNKNGLFVENENIEQLANHISYAIGNATAFDRNKISVETNKKYNYDSVATQFEEWFKSTLKNG
jgi:glycosyltransferase involved in cell wall biosynthesis